MEECILRNKKGQFVKGVRSSIGTEFKKGGHWRQAKPFWNYDILHKLYITKKMSGESIAQKYNVTAGNIYYFLDKLGIKTRSISETRKTKHWGQSGKDNPMFGKLGKANPNWNGGHSPERQCMYARSFWKELKKLVLKRDNYKCTQCNSKKLLVVHHILHWSRYPKYRFTDSNLTTLCVTCHKKMHKKRR